MHGRHEHAGHGHGLRQHGPLDDPDDARDRPRARSRQLYDTSAGHDIGIDVHAGSRHGIDASRGHACGRRHGIDAGRVDACGPRNVEHAGRVHASGPRHVEHAGWDAGYADAAGIDHAEHADAAGIDHAEHAGYAGGRPHRSQGLAAVAGRLHVTPENTDIGDGNFAFTITGPDGAPVKEYTTLHDRDLHLIVASDDLQQYAHLHPMLDDNGRWFVKTPSDFPPGEYRAFADFDPDGAQTQLTLGIDLTKPGAAPAAQPLVPSNKDSVDGFDVSLDFTGTQATVTVRRNGEVVTTQPYLAAAGHLVTLREGDLGYLHVHPMDTAPDGPVNFMVSLPSAEPMRCSSTSRSTTSCGRPASSSTSPSNW